MQYSKYFVFSLAFAVYGYSFALDPKAQRINQAPTWSSIACPSQNFSKFLKEFSEREEVQKAFTKYPLEQQQLDLDADPEPKPFVRNLGRHQIKFPVIPRESERQMKSLTLRVSKIASRRAKLTLSKSDTDYRILYFFSKNSCWKLERIEDWSL